MTGSNPDAGTEVRDSWNAMLDIIDQLPEDRKIAFQELVPQHDAYLIVDAQRGGDGDCTARHLWFHYDSLQFLEVSPWNKGNDPRRQPTHYASKSVAAMDEEI